MISPIFVFDIETVPDVQTGRRMYGLGDLNDKDAANALAQLRRQQTGGSDFLKLPLHRIVAISAVLRTKDAFKVWSLGTSDSDEAELIQRFFDGVEKFGPTLVSWNGGGFDLPVLHYRALLHGISAPRYWDQGEFDKDHKWNNYINRYHLRHTDLMDVLALFQARATATLDDISTLLGFPGKLDMDGSLVWDRYLAGEIDEIRNYCETDVLNTYLIYQRFQLMRGHISAADYREECALVRDELAKLEKPHWSAFLNAWPE
ncbi:MAG: 3'-5' exonuclease [Gammaproteobacteria bacterium]|nr:3'-5' exonuclease [Gammaproteobacteria bacterium]